MGIPATILYGYVAEGDMNDAATRIWEQTLVVRCQAGDHLAFAELVEAFHKRLCYYIERLVEQPNDVDDILQQVWLDVYRKLPRLRSPKAFRVWLYRIARDKVYLGRRRKKSIVLRYTYEEFPLDSHREPAFSVEDIELIHISLQKLSPEHKEVLTLRFMENMTYEEIADCVGCQLGTVRSRL